MNEKETVLITGGSGFVGSHISDQLTQVGYEVRILSRSEKGQGFYNWNTNTGEIDEKVFENLDHIIHLAGANVADGRWTKKQKERIVRSRIASTELLKNSLEKLKHQTFIKSIVCASAIGYYGDRGDELLTESSDPGDDFLSEVCQKWEAATSRLLSNAESFNIVRIGLVLDSEEGAFPKMLLTKRIGILNYFGDGKQYYSWIHIADLVSIFIYLLQNRIPERIINGVAPQPLRNKKFMEIVAEKSGGKLVLPVPKAALHLTMGEMSAIVLNSNNVSSSNIEEAGFTFQYSNFEEALEHLL